MIALAMQAAIATPDFWIVVAYLIILGGVGFAVWLEPRNQDDGCIWGAIFAFMVLAGLGMIVWALV